MTSPASPAPSTAPSAASTTAIGAGRLALLLQESITAITRLRANRQPVTDAQAFRAQMLQLLRYAEQEAAASGYDTGDARLAVFAVVALLDESVLNARQPALAEWARRPLQEELYGGHMAGEWFFQHIDQLLARPDSPALADVLEVYELCLLLGFRGRYGAGDPGALHAIAARAGERVLRIRGAQPDLVPGWRPADDAVVGGDPWVRRLAIALGSSVALVLVLWGVSALTLRGAASEVASLAPATPSAGAPAAR
jgi:type VI secretion system protein ImpK